jgi:hypothetical protein
MAALTALALSLVLLVVVGPGAFAADGPGAAAHLGVASCSGSTCHGRQEGNGATVRQDELARWQDEASQAGMHSRAWRVLGDPKGRAIAAKLGVGDPQTAAACLGCHSDPAPVHRAGWRVSDGIGCETCHGGAAAPWLASHAATGATHARNVANGLYPIDNPRARASLCLDCHFGSARPGQFVDHRLMAAGHPRISFELDLFTALEQHWDEDGDYVSRKGRSDHVQDWAVGQALALQRALTLYQGPRGSEGAFPEFYFFDCHSCHRRIGDSADFRATKIANPGRPTPPGTPPFQDENMIMLSAAAGVVAPGLAARFDNDVRVFHTAMAYNRTGVPAAVQKLHDSAGALASAFSARSFGRTETFAIVDAVATGAAQRYTDYEASAQAVMALDTLLDALVRQGAVERGAAATIRGQIDVAYRAVRDPNAYQPLEFRSALARAAAAIRRLR